MQSHKKSNDFTAVQARNNGVRLQNVAVASSAHFVKAYVVKKNKYKRRTGLNRLCAAKTKPLNEKNVFLKNKTNVKAIDQIKF